MPKVQINTQQLADILAQVVSNIYNEHPTTGALFELQHNTGLRLCEVLEVDRWTRLESGEWLVQLSKREGKRTLPAAVVPEQLFKNYDTHRPFEMVTYSSANNSLKRWAPVFVFNSDQRRTTSHAFRYLYIKQLYQQLESVAAVAAVMGQVNPANTARYIFDDIWMYTQGGE